MHEAIAAAPQVGPPAVRLEPQSQQVPSSQGTMWQALQRANEAKRARRTSRPAAACSWRPV